MNFELYPRTIFLVVAGSQAYGFASPESDWDYRGIAIPPLDTYIGIMDKFEHAVDTDKSKHVYTHYPPGMLKDDADMQVLELTKFVNLACECNPSIIEILFTDPSCYVIKHSIMDTLLNNRQMFLSKAAKPRFCGYALSQLNRIKRHRRWLVDPPSHKPIRAEFGLPEHSLLSSDQIGAATALIQKEVDEFMVDQTDLPEHTKVDLNAALGKMMRAVWSSIAPYAKYPVGDDQPFESTDEALFWGAAKDQGFSENFLLMLAREKTYRAKKKDWDSYQHWLVTRNPARAELERKYGYDCKHATHLVRLIRMAREILEKGEVHVFRPDAEELRSIRNGAWTYEQVVEFAEKEDLALEESLKKSTLPKTADRRKIHEMVSGMVLRFNLGC